MDRQVDEVASRSLLGRVDLCRVGSQLNMEAVKQRAGGRRAGRA